MGSAARLGVLATIAALALVVGGCGGSASDTAGEGAAPASDAAEPPKVRVITVTPITAGTWDPTHNAAYTAAAKENGWDLQVAEAVPYGEAEQVFRRWGSEGVDVVFSTDNGFQDALLAAAERYPDTAWVMMSGLSTTNNLPNVAAHTFEWCELGYLQGAAGAMISESNHIGGVGGVEILPAKQTIEGVRLGAEAVQKDTKVSLRYTGDFVDTQKAQAVVSGLIGAGADVIIGVTVGGMAPQIAARAQAQDAWYIGDVADASKYAPEVTPTSVVVNLKSGYVEAVQGWMSGDFAPEIHITGVSEDTISALPFRLGFDQHNARLQEIEEHLKNDAVEWPQEGVCADVGAPTDQGQGG